MMIEPSEAAAEENFANAFTGSATAGEQQVSAGVPGELLAEQAAAMATEEAPPTAALVKPPLKAKAVGDIAAKEAGTIAGGAGAGVAGLAVAAGLAAVDTAREVAAAAQTQGSIGQYLIAGGGGSTPSNAPMNAVVSAINRIAGLRSRM